MKKKLRLFFMLCAFCILGVLSACTAWAEDSLVPLASDNLEVSLRRYSNIVSLSNGYLRVFYQDSKVYVEYYSDDFQIKSRKTFDLELEYWGGFYAGEDAYYLVEGQKNTDEDSTAEVIRVIKYDLEWNRMDAASITSNPDLFGGEVRYPFDYGCVEFTETNGKLYIVTGHQGYVDDSVGQGHQGFLMIEVDTASMTGQIVDCDLWHSFAQYIESKDTYLYVLEQSEGSRCTKLSRYDTETLEQTSLNIFQYGGSRTSAWAVACYATVDGMALSSSHVLCVGTSIDQSKYDDSSSHSIYNIYLTATPVDDFSETATTVNQITQFTDSKYFFGLKITKVNDNRFLISWEEYTEDDSTEVSDPTDSLSGSVLHYLFVNASGQTVSQEYTINAPISDCQPVVKNSSIVYYASDAKTVNFYSIDSESGQSQKKICRTAGDNATWEYNDGVLTVSGNGALSFSSLNEGRGPIESVGYSYSSSKSPWKTIRKYIKKVVIKSGITSIPERAFSSLPNVEEIEIEAGVQSIEKEAFYNCDSLKKITIPASVTSIGEDILWTGSYWVSDKSHVVSAKIYTTVDSTAFTYAVQNGISYVCDMSEANVSGLEESYTYTGEAIEPEPTVTLQNHTLENGTDYTISYTDNTEAGTASLTITGIRHYTGTVTKQFQISGSSLKKLYATDSASLTATLKASPDKTAASITVPSYITIGGESYKVTAIGANAFKNNKKLKTVKIPSTVTAIGTGAFQNCTALQTVTIGKNVTTIGSQAFANCTSLRKITIPAKVKSIGAKAFYNTKKLTSLTIKTKKLTARSVGSKAFSGAGKASYRKLTVKVPKSKFSAYKKLLRKRGLSSKAKIKK